MPTERVVGLQSDTLSTLPDGPRTIVVLVPMGSPDAAAIMTAAQQQVVTLADRYGALWDQPNDNTLREICEHLKDIKQLLARANGEMLFDQIGMDNIPGPTY